ncbi:MAG TPA: ABC transporter ATP-binding protein [Solirubrobacterales bacterium]|jgi:NitT/TauT family transport system ATP-binding protein|nr:ABC transporter ATP-binding protein [Solirubrobacterales bacterium]
MTVKPKLTIEHVSKEFSVRDTEGPRRGRKNFAAVRDINLEVADGEFLVLVGPSGCGKSTLLDLLAGLGEPSDGQILVDGAPVSGPGLDRGIVFQQYALLPWRTALQNVEFGLEASRLRRRARAERAREHLDLVGLAGFANSYPHQLSGGMKQRVAIARSLAYDPEVLLMDEPFAALDALTRDSLQGQLLRIWEQTGKTVVFITHSIDEAVYLGRRVAVMSARPGRIKAVIDIDIERRADVADLRSSAEFGHYRHLVWEQLRDEVLIAQGLSRDPAADVHPTIGAAEPAREVSSIG